MVLFDVPVPEPVAVLARTTFIVAVSEPVPEPVAVCETVSVPL
jgi:hypothetical protein